MWDGWEWLVARMQNNWTALKILAWVNEQRSRWLCKFFGVR